MNIGRGQHGITTHFTPGRRAVAKFKGRVIAGYIMWDHLRRITHLFAHPTWAGRVEQRLIEKVAERGVTKFARETIIIAAPRGMKK